MYSVRNLLIFCALVSLWTFMAAVADSQNTITRASSVLIMASYVWAVAVAFATRNIRKRAALISYGAVGLFLSYPFDSFTTIFFVHDQFAAWASQQFQDPERSNYVYNAVKGLRPCTAHAIAIDGAVCAYWLTKGEDASS